MKYFKVNATTEWCGYDTEGYFMSEDEDSLYEDINFLEFEMDMIEYVGGDITEEELEENDDAGNVYLYPEEITKEEYEEGIKMNNGRNYTI